MGSHDRDRVIVTVHAARSFTTADTAAGRAVDGIWAWRGVVVAAWFVAVLVLVLDRFWSFWATLV